MLRLIFEWDACGISHYYYSLNTNELDPTCTLWVPIFAVGVPLRINVKSLPKYKNKTTLELLSASK